MSNESEFSTVLSRVHLATIVLLLVFATASIALIVGSIPWDTYLSFVKYAFGLLAVGRALNARTEP